MVVNGTEQMIIATDESTHQKTTETTKDQSGCSSTPSLSMAVVGGGENKKLIY
jgi:hypothetical protein